MGFFRRYKLTDYTLEECYEAMKQLEYDVIGEDSPKRIRTIMEEWACFRELFARHEKENQSQLDTKQAT